MRAAVPPIGPCGVARRTEPSAWLCPPVGGRRMPDGFDLHRTDVAARLPAGAAARGAELPLFHAKPGSGHAHDR